MPPTDPRFLDCTMEDVLLDLWAHRFRDDPQARSEVVSEDFDADMDELEREALDGALPDDLETIAEGVS